ncbi:hypothetical protein FB45DRAFT_933649 [Roridomyces roridus]|uniref:Uncharacterized protein n=1 Tax=Roridomyces roridus TaxID=1738132 RepID=A0AAD7BD04_9AGAR|nr:hypothetical protein FB45DRAFT_933649 [Roridomyces roridus]
MPVFPAEIIQSIVEELPTPFEQAKMCLVSTQCKAAALPVLYRHVKLRSLKMTTRFCATVNKFPARGNYVRSFIVEPEAGADKWGDLLEFTTLRRALLLFSQLEHLHIWIPSYDDDLFHTFTTLTLPRLRRFACHQPSFAYDNLLGDFLARHTTLTELCIIRPFGYQWDNPSRPTDMSMSLPMVPLPALQSYSGSYSYFLRLVVRNRRLAHASFWDIPQSSLDRNVLVHRLANALAQASEPIPGPGLKLSILGDAFGAEAIPILARVLPHLRTLEIGPFVNPPCRLHPTTLPIISSVLKHLPLLTTLSVHSSADLMDPMRAGTNGNRDEVVKQDAVVLTMWAKLCPSLVASRLHNQHWQRLPVPGSPWVMVS